MAVPIEIKTDAGLTGKNQLEHLSKGQIEKKEIPIRIILLLGASCVQDFNLAEFQPLKPEDILRALNPFMKSVPQFVVDWIDAVRMECARRELALELYRSWEDDKEEPYWALGYRSYSHLMYYVLDHVRKSLKQSDSDSSWSLYSGGYNTVLNLNKKDESWIKLDSINAEAFFEFNNEYFVFKIENKEKNTERLRKWLKEIRKSAKEVHGENLPALEMPRSNRLNCTWLSVFRWHFDFSQLDTICFQVKQILKLFGRKGLLGNYL